MVELIKSETFEKWLLGLKDRSARLRIQIRLDRFVCGNPGDIKPLRDGLQEMRIDYGPGYRVYFIRRGVVVVLGRRRQSQPGKRHRACLAAGPAMEGQA